MRNKNVKRGGGGKIIAVLVLLGLLAAAGYVYTAPEFEREVPTIHSEQNVFWNRKEPFNIRLADNEGLKSYELILSDGKNSLIVGQGVFEEKTKEQILSLKYPTSKVLDLKATKLKLKVTVNDSSLWNLGQGNKSEKIIDINVDYTRPNVNIIANSYSITQGGSALVVFQAEDENLDMIYVEAGEEKFKAQPYKKEGYYAALIAWPFTQEDFKAKVVAIDAAKNRRDAEVPFYIKNHQYKVSWIKASDEFINGKITDLATSDPEYAHIEDKLEKLKAIN